MFFHYRNTTKGPLFVYTDDGPKLFQGKPKPQPTSTCKITDGHVEITVIRTKYATIVKTVDTSMNRIDMKQYPHRLFMKQTINRMTKKEETNFKEAQQEASNLLRKCCHNAK